MPCYSTRDYWTEAGGRLYRLPTEAEWEKAARGPNPPSPSRRGAGGEGNRRYPWANDWDKSRCNNQENGSVGTTPVGQFSPQGDSPYGVGDMAGQVWEWCSGKYGGTDAKPKFGYPYRLDDGREELEGDDTRIARGGSWYSDNSAAVCRCGYRDGDRAGIGDINIGFRCARTLSS